MATRKLVVPFNVQIPNTPSTNLFDGPSFPDLVTFKSLWSAGATIIAPIPLSPISPQVWKLLSVAITGYLTYDTIQGTHFGKFGKLVGGLLVNPAVTPVQQVSPMLPLPDDQSLIFDLWNQNADELPPSINNPTNQLPGFGGLPIGGTLSLPTPLELRGDDLITLAVGMWLEPMLLGRATTNGVSGTTYSLIVSGAKVAVTYDDQGY